MEEGENVSNMVVRTNVMALSSHRNLGLLGNQQARASARLSSGYRINTAADDAAGLAITMGMKAQIQGMQQAGRNAQDGISLIQTAEGGLAVIDEMLLRMRVLSVQAANDTYSYEQRQILQNEIDKVMKEIDGVSERTTFNGMQLLQGSNSRISGEGRIAVNGALPIAATSSSTATLAQIQAKIVYELGTIGSGGWIDDSLGHINDMTGLDLLGTVNLNIVFSNSMPSGVLASMTSSSNGVNYTLTFNNRFLTGMSIDFSDANPPLVGGLHLHSLLTHELMHMVQNNNFWNNSPSSGKFMSGIPAWFTEGLAEAIHGGTNLWFADDVSEAEVIRQLTAIRDNPGRASFEAYSAGSLVLLYMDNLSPGGIEGFFNNLKNPAISTFEAAMRASFSGMSSRQLINQMIADIRSNGLDAFAVALGAGSAAGLFGDTFGFGGLSGLAATGIPAGVGSTPNLPFGGGGAGGGRDLVLTLHIGPDAGHSFDISIGSVTTDSLFVNAIDVTTHSSASFSINEINAVLQEVADIRANLGAQQNRLEFTIQNLAISVENLTASQSRIRDADMAKEMMALAQVNVLQQAATAMLTQANQAAQSILQLIG
jgi:flagellin